METRINILDYLQFDSPTKEQVAALNTMSDFVKKENTDDFYTLCGAAGTGKSSITSALIGYLNDRNISYHIAAPTGRAARIIGRKSNCVNSTIHSLIYHVSTENESGEVFFNLKNNDDNERTIFIIDEASMISTLPNNPDLSLFKSSNSLLTDLIKFVKSGNTENKIIFLGDRNQLPPVNEMESLALIPTYLEKNFNLKGSVHFLTEVKRQDDGSYIMKNAVNTRIAIEGNKTHSRIDAFKFNYFSGAITKFVSDFSNNEKDFCISINPFHKGNQLFNKLVRERLFGATPKNVVKNDWMLVTKKWSRNGQELYSGDHVTVEEIDLSQTEIVGGLQFAPIKIKAKDLSGKEIIIDDYILLDSIAFPAGQLPIDQEKKIRAERYRKNPVFRESGFPADDKYIGALRLTYGYSITCHKAQGGEWSKVYMSTFNIPSLKYQYTAITRAINNLVLY
jgi:exodeoxyribonuclease-5